MTDILRWMIGGLMSVLMLGLLSAATTQQAQAWSGSAPYTSGHRMPSSAVRPGLPPDGWFLGAPSVPIDRGAPISERPFAKPFTDRGPSIADRPLAPIGGGVQGAPEAPPYVWCQGGWVRADEPSHRCPWR